MLTDITGFTSYAAEETTGSDEDESALLSYAAEAETAICEEGLTDETDPSVMQPVTDETDLSGIQHETVIEDAAGDLVDAATEEAGIPDPEEDLQSGDAVIMQVAQNYAYDNSGEYLYLYVYGRNVTTQTATPTLYLGEEKAAEPTGRVIGMWGYADDDGQITGRYGLPDYASGKFALTYELKKLDRTKLWADPENTWYTVRFPEGTGTEYGEPLTFSLQNQSAILAYRWNYKKDSVETWLRESAGIKDGTNVTVYVFDTYSYYGSMSADEIDLSQAFTKKTAKVKGNKVVFSGVNKILTDEKRHTAKACFLCFDLGAGYGRYIETNFGYADRCNAEEQHEKLVYVKAEAGSGQAEIGVLLDSTVYGSPKTIDASITCHAIDGYQFDIKLTNMGVKGISSLNVPSGYNYYVADDISNKYQFFERDKYIYEDYGSSQGGVNYRNTPFFLTIKGVNGYEGYLPFAAEDERFIQTEQYAYLKENGVIDVYIESPSAQFDYNTLYDSGDNRPTSDQALNLWNEKGYKVEVFDETYAPVEASVSKVYWDGSHILLVLSSAATDGNVFIRVTKNGAPGVEYATYYDDSEYKYRSFYELNQYRDSGNGEYGIMAVTHMAPSTYDQYLAMDEISNNNAYTGLYLREWAHILPVNVSFHIPGSLDDICSFTVNESDLSDNGNYYFKASDVAKLDPKEVYVVSVESDTYGAIQGNFGYFSYRTAGSSDKPVDPDKPTAADPINKCRITLPKSVTYTGRPIELTEDELKITRSKKDTTELKIGEDYTVRYENNINAGKAKVYITGITREDGSGYNKTVTKTFKITPAKLTTDASSQARVSVGAESSVEFAKGGAKIIPEIKWTSDNGDSWETLKEGVDYKLVFKNHKKIGTGAKMTVKGIGNYKGSSLPAITYEVVTKSMSKISASCPDKKYNASKKGKYYMSTPVLYDTDGKKLAAKKDYKVTGYVREDKEEIFDKNSMVTQGETLYAVVEGTGGYTGTIYVPFNVQ